LFVVPTGGPAEKTSMQFRTSKKACPDDEVNQNENHSEIEGLKYEVSNGKVLKSL